MSPNPDGTVAWREVYDEAVERLRRRGHDSAAIDVRRIAERAAGIDPDEFHALLDRPVTTRQIAAFDRMIERRLTGEPLQYVVGGWAFRHLDLYLDRRVLIPRPETEVVTEHALAEYDRVRRRNLGTARGVVVDLGTGSGAIALSFAFERDELDVYATDVSPDALEVARANLAGLGRRARAVRVVAGDWYAALPGELRGQVDLVVSNPPYIADGEAVDAQVTDWEPRHALFSGPTGCEAFLTIFDEAREWLHPHGSVVVEIGASQAAAVAAIARRAGFTHVGVERDLVGRDRVVIASLG